MESIFDIVTAQSVAAYWNNIPGTSVPRMGSTLFPAKKQMGVEIKYIKGKNGLPIELKLSSLDAKVMIRDRRGFDEISTKLPFFKEAKMIDEELRQKLLMVLATRNQAYIDSVLNNIFNDEAELIDSADVSLERMRMQLISTGVINIANNGQAYTYDYGVTSDQKKTLTGTAMWSDLENSNPIADLNNWAEEAKLRTGVRPTRVVMTSTTFNYILGNKALAKSIYVTNNGLGIVTDSMVKDAIKVLANLSIGINDDVYQGTDGKAKKYFPDNVVSLLPDGKLGDTVYGTTPEEADLMSAPNIANVRIVNTGVAVTTIKQADPVNVVTKVSQMAMPTFEQADKIVIATVAQ